MASILRSKYFLLASIFTSVVALDQWTKYLIYSQFRYGESIPVIKSFFAITYVRNSGAAFGLMHSAPPAFRDPFFIAMPLIAMVVIGFLFHRLRADQKWVGTAYSLIVAGAIGNLIDRIKFGYVVDFLDFHWKGMWHWPAFNVADSCIVAGVIMMFIDSIFQSENQPATSN